MSSVCWWHFITFCPHWDIGYLKEHTLSNWNLSLPICGPMARVVIVPWGGYVCSIGHCRSHRTSGDWQSCHHSDRKPAHCHLASQAKGQVSTHRLALTRAAGMRQPSHGPAVYTSNSCCCLIYTIKCFCLFNLVQSYKICNYRRILMEPHKGGF